VPSIELFLNSYRVIVINLNTILENHESKPSPPMGVQCAYMRMGEKG